MEKEIKLDEKTGDGCDGGGAEEDDVDSIQ
jgi:hypothetical protein